MRLSTVDVRDKDDWPACFQEIRKGFKEMAPCSVVPGDVVKLKVANVCSVYLEHMVSCQCAVLPRRRSICVLAKGQGLRRSTDRMKVILPANLRIDGIEVSH